MVRNDSGFAQIRRVILKTRRISVILRRLYYKNLDGGVTLKRTTITLLLLALALAFSVSCNDPESPIDDDDPGIEWPGMTSRDDVVRTLLLTYANPKEGESVSKFNALLHSSYFFALNPSDVGVGGSPVLARAEDIAATEWIFESTSLLDLSVAETGTWNSYPEIDGEPCIDCWESTREYRIRAQFGDEDTTYQSPAGRASVIIIVARDEADSSKWVIRAMYDIMSN
jgi:hypothetical protein